MASITTTTTNDNDAVDPNDVSATTMTSTKRLGQVGSNE